MIKSTNIFHALSRNEDGGTAVEYALLIGCLVLMIFASISLYGENMAEMFDHVRSVYIAAVGE
jgi:Flp pilus assembly pilin Flp